MKKLFKERLLVNKKHGVEVIFNEKVWNNIIIIKWNKKKYLKKNNEW